MHCTLFFFKSLQCSLASKQVRVLGFRFFFRSFPYLICNHTMIPATKLAYIILKYICKYFRVIIPTGCDTEGFLPT